MNDPFLSEFERLLDEKFEIVRTMTDKLRSAPDASAISQVLRRAMQRFRHFRQTAEIPFEQQFGDRLKTTFPQARPLMEKHSLRFASFLSELQRLKYDEPYVSDHEIAAVVAEFEFETAHIPARPLV